MHLQVSWETVMPLECCDCTELLCVARGQPNFTGSQVCLLYNLNFDEWDDIGHTESDQNTITFLRYGFSTGYEGPIPTRLSGNHPSAMKYPRDVATYIVKGLSEEAILTPFDTSLLFLLPDEPTPDPA